MMAFSCDEPGKGGLVVCDELEYGFDGVSVLLDGLFDGHLRRFVKGQAEDAVNGFVWRRIDVGVGFFEYLLEDLVIEKLVSNQFGG